MSNNNLLIKDEKLIKNSSDVLYKCTGANKLARAYSTGVWDKPLVGGRLSEIGLYPRVFDSYKWLVDNNLYDNLVFGINRQSGYLPNEITGADHLHTAYDLSKYNNDAIQATAANQPKIVSKGWYCDDINDTYIECTDAISNPLFAGDELSIMFWAYSKKHQNDIGYVCKFMPVNPADGQFAIRQRDNRYQILLSADGESFYVISSGISVILNEWQFFVLTFKNTQIYAYLNSNLVSERSDAPSSLYNSEQPLWIGRYRRVADNNNAIMNDIYIYQKELTSAQITSYYNLTKHKYGH